MENPRAHWSILLVSCGTLLCAAPALAIPPGGGGDFPPLNHCLTDTQGSLTATPATVALGQSTVLQFSATVPAGCTNVRIALDGQPVAHSGTVTVTPVANATYRLHAVLIGAGERDLASAAVAVTLPPLVQITANNQVPLFVQAVSTPNTIVQLANDVQLDLSNWQDIAVASGVTIRGGRGGLQDGPRLFTTTRPEVLFSIASWVRDIRITGVRIEGPDMGVPDRQHNRAIQIDSAVHIEIDHDEISGFSLAGIQILDTQGTMPSPDPSTDTGSPGGYPVRIHDNYIHNNEAIGGDGYGIVVGEGAHPLIDRNTFDWNRHSIAGDGHAGTGYSAYDNLVLEHGGLHRWIPFPGFWIHTHQFDMHGTDNCGVWDAVSDSLWNCGSAGHTMIIRRNTFFYAEDNDIKLRGTPAVGMFVGDNVFANFLDFGSAASQTESGLVDEKTNVYGYNGSLHLGTCDFDGDGVNDSFMATGTGWWYSSGGNRPWQYLNTSTKHLDEVSLGYFDGDNRCDVSADGVIYPGGRAPQHLPPRLGTIGVFTTR